jgi:hypothetical protein
MIERFARIFSLLLGLVLELALAAYISEHFCDYWKIETEK